tara:strand:- start:1024 stop:1209 length:186 start_codon:yes stop_codon:yes gene_type:complete
VTKVTKEIRGTKVRKVILVLLVLLEQLEFKERKVILVQQAKLVRPEPKATRATKVKRELLV